jgi:hypothetical protein
MYKNFELDSWCYVALCLYMLNGMLMDFLFSLLYIFFNIVLNL